MDVFKKGWFSELNELWPGQAMSLQVEEVLLHEKSKYQDVMVFRSKTHGNVLILDGVIQCTEKDEFSYQEMMAHIPLNSHPNPKKVLIIGGGDGGVLREVVKHPFVETVDQCEIDENTYSITLLEDPPYHCYVNSLIGGSHSLINVNNVVARGGNVPELLPSIGYGQKYIRLDWLEFAYIPKKVIEVSKKYLPHMACGYDSPKVNLHIGDGFDFMKKHKGEYDVIITDSSDPVGPASSLFQKSYYELMKAALKPDGILCCQGECLWLHLNLIKGMLTFCRTVFPVSDYAFTTIPTYPSGQIGFILCSSNPDTNFKEPVTIWGTKELKILKLKYYNSDVHKAAFTLPQFAREVLFEAEDHQTTKSNGIACNNGN